jgi:hypothetical protein
LLLLQWECKKSSPKGEQGSFVYRKQFEGLLVIQKVKPISYSAKKLGIRGVNQFQGVGCGSVVEAYIAPVRPWAPPPAWQQQSAAQYPRKDVPRCLLREVTRL